MVDSAMEVISFIHSVSRSLSLAVLSSKFSSAGAVGTFGFLKARQCQLHEQRAELADAVIYVAFQRENIFTVKLEGVCWAR